MPLHHLFQKSVISSTPLANFHLSAHNCVACKSGRCLSNNTDHSRPFRTIFVDTRLRLEKLYALLLCNVPTCSTLQPAGPDMVVDYYLHQNRVYPNISRRSIFAHFAVIYRQTHGQHGILIDFVPVSKIFMKMVQFLQFFELSLSIQIAL